MKNIAITSTNLLNELNDSNVKALTFFWIVPHKNIIIIIIEIDFVIFSKKRGLRTISLNDVEWNNNFASPSFFHNIYGLISGSGCNNKILKSIFLDKKDLYKLVKCAYLKDVRLILTAD